MDEGAAERPDRQALLTLLARLEELYQQGGPETPDGRGPYAPDPWAGEVLASLRDRENDDPATFAPVAASLGLNTGPGLLALVRLTAVKATAAGIRYAMAEDNPNGSGPVTADEVLGEVSTTQWWL